MQCIYNTVVGLKRPFAPSVFSSIEDIEDILFH
jgi:hypothetical protein